MTYEPPVSPPDDDFADAGRCCARCGSSVLRRTCPEGDRVAHMYAQRADTRYSLRPSCITRDELSDMAAGEIHDLRTRVRDLEATLERVSAILAECAGMVRP